MKAKVIEIGDSKYLELINPHNKYKVNGLFENSPIAVDDPLLKVGYIVDTDNYLFVNEYPRVTVGGETIWLRFYDQDFDFFPNARQCYVPALRHVKCCTHMYTKSMDQEYPRKCVGCGEPEESKLPSINETYDKLDIDYSKEPSVILESTYSTTMGDGKIAGVTDLSDKQAEGISILREYINTQIKMFNYLNPTITPLTLQDVIFHIGGEKE